MSWKSADWKNVLLLAVFCMLTIPVQSQIRSEVGNTSTTNFVVPSDDLEITEKVWLNQYTDLEVELYDIVSTPVPNAKVPDGITLPQKFKAYAVPGMEQKKAFAFIQISKYIQNSSGKVEQIVSYKYKYTPKPGAPRKTRGSRVYADNSVLASGTFYKIAVASEGMYVIDYNFIKNSLGVEPSSINVNNIRLYGNGGTMLDENNATQREDDLAENHIELVGMQDGVFNTNDYIVFFAEGPHKIIADSASKKISHRFNLYSDTSYYFLNFDKGPGQRIQTQGNDGAATVSTNTYDDYQYFEKDEYNFGRFGKLWWGSRLNTSSGLQLQIPINTAGMQEATVNCFVGAIASSGVSSMSLSAAGTALGSQSLTAIGNEFYEPTIRAKMITANYVPNANITNFTVTLTPGNDFANGYIDYFSIQGLKTLAYDGATFRFRHFNSSVANNIVQYNIQAAQQPTVWDITDPLRPIIMNVSSSGSGVYSFTRKADKLRQFVCFTNATYKKPTYIGRQANQNLHSYRNIDYLIVTAPEFLSEANRLADYRRNKQGLRTLVVTTQQVYNEFSSGSQDVTAIRDFAKMFYDRATSAQDMPKYLLLFGDASFDYKKRINPQTNFAPTFETAESISKIYGYCTDDFFGMLDDNENINTFFIANTLDIGVGRIPSSSITEARTVVNKILTYESAASFGAWKNTLTFCADNGDNSVHAIDGEIMSQKAADSFLNGNIYKVYVDAYPLVSTPAGDRTIQGRQALEALLFNGTLLVNYNGHGGPDAWCEERLFDQSYINSYNNLYKLPLYVTATCDFAPFDQSKAPSAGERLLLYDKGGAIALMTTTQLVYQNENRIMNRDYMSVVFKPMSNGAMPALGDAYRLSKNLTYIGQLSESVAANFRKFALLGDPALHLAIPTLKVVADSLNGKALNTLSDTLKALNKYTLNGRVLDEAGNTNTQFNGTVSITIFDKPRKLQTLGGNANTPKINYQIQNGIVFKGSATVVNGKYSVQFVVPKDIDYTIGRGKISLYAQSTTQDASGADTNIIIGGVGNSALVDNDGPIVKPYINNNKFISGGIVPPNCNLYVELTDSNGINATGSSVGHDITAVIDENTATPIILNTFYEAAKDDYKNGTVTYPLKDLALGPHTITIKAWDVLNNSGSASLDFVVVAAEEPQIDRVINYPNPFTTSTNFGFDHNQGATPLYVTIEIYTVAGTLVKTIQTVSRGESSRVSDISWDGTDFAGQKLGRGTYMYKVYYRTPSGKSAYKYQKLVIL